jgi:hypothetical protein
MNILNFLSNLRSHIVGSKSQKYKSAKLTSGFKRVTNPEGSHLNTDSEHEAVLLIPFTDQDVSTYARIMIRAIADSDNIYLVKIGVNIDIIVSKDDVLPRNVITLDPILLDAEADGPYKYDFILKFLSYFNVFALPTYFCVMNDVTLTGPLFQEALTRIQQDPVMLDVLLPYLHSNELGLMKDMRHQKQDVSADKGFQHGTIPKRIKRY